tara:strand:- start:44 stop:748 length:705 start_codon:yes stop_codon:yes gene_type:complete
LNLNNHKILAIIPAREGSKGIKFKNRINFYGKPLIHWTITEALKSKLIGKIIVSTDDKKILKLNKNYNDNRLIFETRSKNISKDNSLIYYTIKKILKENNTYKNFILLQPDSPLRKLFHIEKSIKEFIKSNATTCVSVCKTKKPPDLFYKINNKNFIINKFLKNKNPKNKQYFEYFYEINGAVYISKSNEYLKNKSFLSNKTLTFNMEKDYSIEIDNKFDLQIAKLFFKKNNLR